MTYTEVTFHKGDVFMALSCANEYQLVAFTKTYFGQFQ